MSLVHELSLVNECLNPIDRKQLRAIVRPIPVPNFQIDNFLREEFAHQVADAYPTFEQAAAAGKQFKTVNEQHKIQMTDAATFPEPIAKLNAVLASPEFLDLLSYAMNIPNLLADAQLVGGGMHQTGPRGRLDVHVDFNYLADRQWHRRLNVIVFFNRGWQQDWGGCFELWDEHVKVCHHSVLPVFNRCVAFETNEVSFHGVTGVTCPPGQTRKSFATYYYTEEAPAHWNGVAHSTIFRARPDEKLKGNVLMPAEKAVNWAAASLDRVKRAINKIAKR